MPADLGREARSEFVLDAGAFLAWERNDQRVRAIVALALAGSATLRTSSGVVAQVWRGGGGQARLARLLNGDLVDERALDRVSARQLGLLAAETGAIDVVDGHISLLGRRPKARVVTSDAEDLIAWGVPAGSVIRC